MPFVLALVVGVTVLKSPLVITEPASTDEKQQSATMPQMPIPLIARAGPFTTGAPLRDVMV
jgi:hypothetical protein